MVSEGFEDHVKKYGKTYIKTHRRNLLRQQLFFHIHNVSEAIKRILTPLNIRTSFQPYKTFREILVHPKDSVEESKRSGIVFLFHARTAEKSTLGRLAAQ